MDVCYNYNLDALRCCFTTRHLGSMSFARQPREVALENYRQLERATGISPEQMVRPFLDNGVAVTRVDETDAGRGVVRPVAHLKGVDAVYTDVPELYLAITAADCYSLILYERERRVLGIAHCGWRGIVNRLEHNLFNAMTRDFHCRPANTIAIIGPGIGPCCYIQHDNGLRDAFAAYRQRRLIVENPDGTYHIDISLALMANLNELGITEIVHTRLCTGCKPEFFSARLEGYTTGRTLNLAAIKLP